MATTKIKGMSKAEEEIKRKLQLITRDQALLNEIGKDVVTNIKLDASKGLQPNGTKMTGYAESTIKKKEKDAKKRKIPRARLKVANLRNTGEMIDSIKYFVDSVRSKIIITATGRRGKITNAQLMGFHQEGKGNLPKRSALGISKKTLKIIQEKLIREIRRRLK